MEKNNEEPNKTEKKEEENQIEKKEEENKTENKEEENKIENKEEENQTENKEEENKNSFEKLFEEANNNYTSKNHEKAEELYNDILNKKNELNLSKENLLDLYLNIAKNYYEQLKYNESINYLSNIIIKLDMNNKEAYLIILNILYDLNEYERAERLIEKIKKRFKSDELKYFEKIFHFINDALNEENDKKEIEKNYKSQKFNLSLKENKYIQFLFFLSLILILYMINYIGKYLTQNF
jgi:hypothetical protein